VKRWAFTIILFLLLGAIVNVAVAWGCAQLSGISLPESALAEPDLTPELAEWWLARFPERDPYPRELSSEQLLMDFDPGGAIVWEAEAFGISACSMIVLVPKQEASCTWAGWPMKTMSGEWRWLQQQPGLHDVGLIRFALIDRHKDDPWSYVFHRFLPLRPIWPGFAINTVFYALILWLLFAGPFVLRRRWRIRRGLCPKCAYDLRKRPSDSSVCPECGAAPAPRLLNAA